MRPRTTRSPSSPARTNESHSRSNKLPQGLMDTRSFLAPRFELSNLSRARSNPTRSSLGYLELLRPLAHKLAQSFHILHRRLRQNAVPQIKNMSRPPACLPQNIFGARLNFLPLRKKQRRIQISLHRSAITQTFPAFIEGNAPVEPDHLGARLLHRRQ